MARPAAAWSFGWCIITCLQRGAIRQVLRHASLEFLPASEPLGCLRNISRLGVLNNTPPIVSVSRAKREKNIDSLNLFKRKIGKLA